MTACSAEIWDEIVVVSHWNSYTRLQMVTYGVRPNAMHIQPQNLFLYT